MEQVNENFVFDLSRGRIRKSCLSSAGLDDPAPLLEKIAIKLNFFPTGVQPYYYLRDVFASWNSVSRYFLHVCRQHRWDYPRARYLESLPGVRIYWPSRATSMRSFAIWSARS